MGQGTAISRKMPELDRAGARPGNYRTTDHGTTRPPEWSCRVGTHRTPSGIAATDGARTILSAPLDWITYLSRAPFSKSAAVSGALSLRGLIDLFEQTIQY